MISAGQSKLHRELLNLPIEAVPGVVGRPAVRSDDPPDDLGTERYTIAPAPGRSRVTNLGVRLGRVVSVATATGQYVHKGTACKHFLAAAAPLAG